MQMKGRSGATDRLGTQDTELRMLVREHQRDRSETHLGVDDPAARVMHAGDLLGAEDGGVEVQRRRSVPDAKIGKDLQNAGLSCVGSRGHGDSPSPMAQLWHPPWGRWQPRV